MATQTVFGGVVDFLQRLGIYDVVLPFLLVFTIVFAVLEKTRLLGVDKIDGKEWTKKNLNAIVAFVISFLVIASTTIVRAINEALANVVLLLILVLSFLMLVGVLFGTTEVTLKEHPSWTKFFMVVVFIAIVAIFLQAFGILRLVVGFIILNYDLEWVATLLLIIVVIIFMVYVTRDSHGGESGSGDKSAGTPHK